MSRACVIFKTCVQAMKDGVLIEREGRSDKEFHFQNWFKKRLEAIDLNYVFGRYPAKPDGNQYPVLDLVFCHGSFLNADHEYVHQNKSFRGFGSYGDILVRDRKMYVAPTPYALAEGTAHRRTLLLPAAYPVDDDLVEVGTLTRREVAHVVVAYSFDLRTNDFSTTLVPNPQAGTEHVFKGVP
ncbi:MAG: hypothetical protein ETSY2_21770, partial [Candidatus Entotheonella gemina]